MSSQVPVPSGLALIDNSTTRLSDVLAKCLLSAQSADIHVAYLLSSGIELLEPELQYFLRKGRRLTPDGCRVISVFGDRTLRVRDLQTRQELAYARYRG
jgi:hypothetical protein